MSTNVTIKGQVKQDKEHLSTCSYQELLTWANEHGIDNRSAWGKYKAALKEIGVDFDTLRGASRLAKRAELTGSATHRLLLYSDAKASVDRFGICGPDREPVWYGRFFIPTHTPHGRQTLRVTHRASRSSRSPPRSRRALRTGSLDATTRTVRQRLQSSRPSNPHWPARGSA